MNTKSLVPNSYKRHSVRLKGFDYRQPGAYFITLVSWQRKCLFGEVVDGRMRLNSIGNIIHSEWRRLADHFPHIRLEAFVVMPNHVHGIIVIERSSVGATRPLVEEIMDGHEPMDIELKNSRNGSPQQQMSRISSVGATRPLVEEIMDGHEPMDIELKNSRNGSPQQQTTRPNGPTTNSLGAMIGQFKSRATKRIWKLQGINRHPVWQRNYYEHIIRNDLEYQRIIQYIENNPPQWEEDQLHPFMPVVQSGINNVV